MNLLTKTVTNSKFWNLKLKIISTIFFAMTFLAMQNAKWRWKISIIWQAKGPAKRWEVSGQILDYCLNRPVLSVCHKNVFSLFILYLFFLVWSFFRVKDRQSNLFEREIIILYQSHSPDYTILWISYSLTHTSKNQNNKK